MIKQEIVIRKNIINGIIQQIWIYILILSILITTGGALNFISPTGTDLLNVLIFLLSIKPIIYFICNKKNTVKILFISIIWIIVNSTLNIDRMASSIIFLFRFIAIFSLIKYCDVEGVDIYNYMYKLISFISIYSLLLYIVIQFLNIPISYKPIDTGNYRIYKSYWNIYYWLQTIDLNGNVIIRNSSIFWEPGMYQIFLNYCVYYLLFQKKFISFRDKINLILLSVSILSTTSTSGIMVLIILYVLKIYSTRTTSKLILILKLFSNIALTLGGILAIIYLINQKSGSVSMIERMNDLLIPIKLFWEKPFFGWGYLNYDIYDIYTVLSNNKGNSNGIMSLLYQTGLIGVIFYSYYIMIMIKSMSNKLTKNKLFQIVSLVIFIIISNMTEPIIYSNFTLIFLAVGYSRLDLEYKDNIIVGDKG